MKSSPLGDIARLLVGVLEISGLNGTWLQEFRSALTSVSVLTTVPSGAFQGSIAVLDSGAAVQLRARLRNGVSLTPAGFSQGPPASANL